MERTYFCIDLKTFYASVECVERGLDPFATDLVVADPSRGQGAICLAISPHLKTCERKDLLGASAHNLDIVRVKEDE